MTPGLRFRLSRAARFPVFLHRSCCSARPELRSPPAFSLPFRACSRRSCSSPLDASASLGDLMPFGASVPKESTYPVRPTAQVKVPRRVSHPPRFAPLPASQVYFTPLTPFGFTLQGFPLSESLDSSSLPTCRHAVSPVAALPRPRIAGPPAHLTLLLGVQRWCLGPASRPCSL
jgi:hypothetical protein